MVRAGKALMYSKGYLPTAKDSHKTIIEFTKLVLGEQYANPLLLDPCFSLLIGSPIFAKICERFKRFKIFDMMSLV